MHALVEKNGNLNIVREFVIVLYSAVFATEQGKGYTRFAICRQGARQGLQGVHPFCHL
jgi:hypothetical protein